MSNILQFRSFHERHFSPEQVQYWQQHILNRQQQGQQQQQQHDTWQWQKYNESYAPYHDNDQNVADQETYVQEEDTEINMEREQETTLSQQQQQQQQQQTSLSQEAIEIFKFSEAYRKEREESEEKNIEEEHDKWITDAYRNGVEAPVTCLVYHDNNSDNNDLETTVPFSSSSSEHIRIQEHILNSNYLDTCRKGQTVLWPVLPLRL